jgi:hypothetical protein
MQMKKALLAALAVASTAMTIACTTMALAASPEWIGGSPKKYPGSSYLIGRGTGSSAEEAQNRARGDLATIFEVRVEVVTENTTTVAKSGNKEQVNKVASQQVSAKTDKVINGINIAEVWRDPATMDFHALAVLSRSQAAASLQEEIGKVDTAVQLEVDNAKAAGDPFLKIGALTRAMETAINRDGFQASLKVVDPSGRGVDAPIPQAVIRAQLDETLKSVKVAPEVEDDAGAKEFGTILKGGLAAAGFLAEGAARADFALVGKLSLNDLGVQNGWNWMRGTVEVRLVEKASGRVRGSKTWPLKASAKDAKTARSRVLIEAEKLLQQDLRPTIIGFAAS